MFQTIIASFNRQNREINRLWLGLIAFSYFLAQLVAWFWLADFMRDLHVMRLLWSQIQARIPASQENKYQLWWQLTDPATSSPSLLSNVTLLRYCTSHWQDSFRSTRNFDFIIRIGNIMSDLTKISQKCHMRVAPTALGDDFSVESYLT